MADTILGKEADGYGYKYTDIAGIHRWLESKGMTYYQYVETDEHGNDYIYTVPILDGKAQEPRRGCKIVMATLNGKSNPAQEQGSAITYARRYSLLMAFGLATTDDDAACMTVPKVEAEEVKDTPKEKKKTAVKGYPAREVMLEVINKRFPEGSKIRDELLKMNDLQSIEEMTDAQMATVYNKVGGR